MFKMRPDGTMSTSKRWMASGMRKPAKLRLWITGIITVPIVVAIVVIIAITDGRVADIAMISAMAIAFGVIMYMTMTVAEKFQNKMINDKVGGTLTADDRADLYLWFAAGQELPERLKSYRAGYLKYAEAQMNGGTKKQRWLFTGLFSFAFLANVPLLFDDGAIDWSRVVLLIILLVDILLFMPVGGLGARLRRQLTRTSRRRVAELRESLAKEPEVT